VNEETPALECRGLASGYGSMEVLRGLDFRAPARSVTAILGPNGAGKTTALLTMAGLLPRLRGEVLVHGKTTPSGRPVAANSEGIVLVPDDRALFNTLTVEEHLILGAKRSGIDPRSLLDVFPALEQRWRVVAGALSGGEQQMLAVARGLAQGPQVLLIDEMSMGLAPVVVEALLPVVRAIVDEHDAVVVLVEQHVSLALEVADHALVLARGKVVVSGTAAELAADGSALERAYLGAD
jgi:branched-chain amino acid transport system ATP-binding protein